MALDAQLKNAPRAPFVLIGLGMLAIYYFNMFDDGTALDKTFAETQTKIQSEQTRLDETKKLAGDKKKFEEELSKLSELFRAAVEFLPENFEEYQLFSLITREAQVAGITVKNLSPKKEKPLRDFYQEIYFEFEITGSYSALVTFLANISRSNRIVNVNEVVMGFEKLDSGNTSINMKGNLVSYRFINKP